jgi:hypothetical protein
VSHDVGLTPNVLRVPERVFYDINTSHSTIFLALWLLSCILASPCGDSWPTWHHRT